MDKEMSVLADFEAFLSQP